MTLDVEVTPEIVKAARDRVAEFGAEFRVFTDTPLNVWAAGPPGPSQQRRPKPAPIRKPIANNNRLVRIAADYEPHPEAFERIAAHFGGKVHNVREAKYTDRPMDALISIPKDTDVTNMIENGFAIDEEGVWTMEPIGVAFGVRPPV